ncbi:hypothetical protein HCBG_07592 [Histoplasma capsulatum G186AR]|uniref:Uncharacterized protein n=1 Tax=Ajellomyces capsulatus (strain G186AR / H82 / ATCC MYA-2454 / RMSCC 2432) TaxID=447093 RepID=C0NWR2_AJECG|nr:uncharacterized protein HCBG_07592 [Histoplasma capsulatum G186AR]EEH04367.1 hypothetical protein HCBG_07592 [Histoplasma capsulatum G186AR]
MSSEFKSLHQIRELKNQQYIPIPKRPGRQYEKDIMLSLFSLGVAGGLKG